MRHQHRCMPTVPANGVELCYEVDGKSNEIDLLMIMGLGGQLISWDPGFCSALVERGFRTIRFDNRDTGLSVKCEETGFPDIGAALRGDGHGAPYTVEDMADDAAGLLDALGIESAHIMGVSMGGMISQALAIRHPSKVLSLCSIMSTTGDRSVGAPTSEAIGELLKPPPQTREEYIDSAVSSFTVIGSPGFPIDEEMMRRRAAEEFDRMHYPAGVARQLAGILASPDRTEMLGAVRAPTLVIHGGADPLVTPSGGEATAKAIPGAQYMALEGMGHSIPKELWGLIADAIVANARQSRTTRKVIP